MNNQHCQESSRTISIVLWGIIFIAFRATIIASLFLITGENEVASDVDYHTMLLEQPFAILGGTASADIASYAPLQSFITWPIYTFYSLLFPSFVAIRLLMMTIEFAGFVVCMLVLRKKTKSDFLTIALCVCFVFAPHQFLTSVVFVQDEVICLFFLLLCVWFKLDDKYLASLFALAAGILFGKIFLIVPLFYVIIFGNSKHERWPKYWWIPLSFVGGIYAIVIGMVQLRSGNLPLVGFTPSADYSVMYWTLLLEHTANFAAYKHASLLLTVTIQALLTLSLIYWCYLKRKTIDTTLLISLPLALFFLTFYQHNSEYSMMIAAPALIMFHNVRAVLLAAAVFSFAWVPKFLFGFKNIGLNNATASATRNQVLGDTIGQLGANFTQLHFASILIYSVLYLTLTIVLLYKLFRPKSDIKQLRNDSHTSSNH